MLISLLWCCAIVFTIAIYLREVYSRFSKYGVPHKKPVPFLGNVAGIALQKYHIVTDFEMLYHQFPNDRFIGRFELLTPVVVIKDLDLLKQVTTKDFEYFIDHRTIVDPEVDKMFGRNLFQLRGQEWKDMRSTLSPAFTSSKIRSMVPFMKDVNNQMLRVLVKQVEESKSGSIDMECKDIMTRYANDVIATCAFGVKIDSHSNTDNDFYVHGRATAHFGFKRMLISLGYASFPSIMKKFNVKLFGGESENFFKRLFLDTMSEREAKNIIRPDMIHLLMQANKGKLTRDEQSPNDDVGFATAEESDVDKRLIDRCWSDDDLVAQAFLFFLAGFETVSSAISFLLYELALNPDVQDRLVAEIREHDAKNNGNFDYSTIQSMKYMDMVISELLRLWPPAVGLDRITNRDYNLGKPNAEAKQDFIIRKGEPLTIPVWAIHRDPAYFENPGKFDPERFSDENKHKIKPFSYIPFGIGPRNCIGSRFALCEVKVMTYQFLKQMEVSPCEKTTIPAVLNPAYFTLSFPKGHWVKLTPRK